MSQGSRRRLALLNSCSCSAGGCCCRCDPRTLDPTASSACRQRQRPFAATWQPSGYSSLCSLSRWAPSHWPLVLRQPHFRSLLCSSFLNHADIQNHADSDYLYHYLNLSLPGPSDDLSVRPPFELCDDDDTWQCPKVAAHLHYQVSHYHPINSKGVGLQSFMNSVTARSPTCPPHMKKIVFKRHITSPKSAPPH